MKKTFTLLACALLTIASVFQSAIPVRAVGADEGTGSITITNAQNGVSYLAYQLFSASYSTSTATGATEGVSYSTDDAGKTFFEKAAADLNEPCPFEFTASGTGFWQVTQPDGMPADMAVGFLNSIKSQIETQFAGARYEPTSTNEHLVQFDALPYGYYFITSSSGATVTLTTAAPSAEVIEKTQQPEIDVNAKKVQQEGQWVSWAPTSVGDTRTFRIEFQASNYIDETPIPSYTLSDRSDNLAIDLNTLNLTIGSLSIPYSDFASHSITASSSDSLLTIQIPWTDASGQPIYQPAPIDVVLTYDAKVEDEAARSGASNTVTIAYNDQSATSSVDLVCLSFVLNKYDKQSAEQQNPITLDGAQFTLWSAEEGGVRIPVIQNADGGYDVTGASSKTMIEAGSVQIHGLNAGTYYLQEEKAPDGYNLLPNRVPVEISVPTGGESQSSIDVLNAKGQMLPSTGENGNFALYMGALLLSGAAIGLLIWKRKKSESSC